MTPEVWADILATIRFVFTQLLQIVTVLGVIASGYFAYRAKLTGDRNAAHLARQDVAVAEVDRKVDGHLSTMISKQESTNDLLASVVKDKAELTAVAVTSDATIERLTGELARKPSELIVSVRSEEVPVGRSDPTVPIHPHVG
jgi:hypothetical protein